MYANRCGMKPNLENAFARTRAPFFTASAQAQPGGLLFHYTGVRVAALSALDAYVCRSTGVIVLLKFRCRRPKTSSSGNFEEVRNRGLVRSHRANVASKIRTHRRGRVLYRQGVQSTRLNAQHHGLLGVLAESTKEDVLCVGLLHRSMEIRIRHGR